MQRRFLLLSFVLALLMGACGGGDRDADAGAPVEPAGPALIMFYTDG